MPRRDLALLSLPFALAACVAATPPAEDACGAAALQGLAGQDRSVLAAMTLPNPTRVIEPGMAVTMDYNPARLNIWLDEGGRIDKIMCG